MSIASGARGLPDRLNGCDKGNAPFGLTFSVEVPKRETGMGESGETPTGTLQTTVPTRLKLLVLGGRGRSLGAADAMPTVRDLWAASAAKGGMEMTIEFEYDEHVAVVMAAFRERTRTPHASMPLVHRVDVLREHASRGGWSTRKRRFFTHNDAPEWVRRVSGGDYLVGIERVEWNDAEGCMRMYTVNESHAEKIVAEELCVIRKHPRDGHRTVKTLTVRARLCVRGWWTLGLSTLAERFLLGRYELLVQQGKKIELDEIERWRVSGRADAVANADARKETRADAESDSPVSTLRRSFSREDAESADKSLDGLAVESLEAFERSLRSDSGEKELSAAATPARAGARDSDRLGEDEWLSAPTETPPFKTPPRPNGGTYHEENAGSSTGATGATDVGTPGAAARRFLSPPSAADARALRKARWSASLRKESLKKSLLREQGLRERGGGDRAEEARSEAAIARRLGLETDAERAAARSLAWRRAVVRVASCCALAAAAHERRAALEPLTARLRRAGVAANRALTRPGRRREKAARRERAREHAREARRSARAGFLSREDEDAKENAEGDRRASGDEGSAADAADAKGARVRIAEPASTEA